MAITSDLTGFKNGRLTVVSLRSTGNRTYWNCICDCGKEFFSEANCIKTGKTKSCGCFRRDETTRRKTVHNFRHHPLYDIWCHIKDRCFNPKNPSYHNYGGRGITMCHEWRGDAKAFIEWCLANGWKDNLEIDREENDGDYCPSNCRFVTRLINSFNRRTTVKIEHHGQMLTTLELEKISNGISASRIFRRIRDCGWSVEDAISVPIRQRSL